MSLGSTSLKLKAAALVVFLAILVLPSFGRCPSLRLPPPAAAPVYVPASGPGPGLPGLGSPTTVPAPAPLADASGPTLGPTPEPNHESCNECAARCAKGCNSNAYEAACTDDYTPESGPYCDICRSATLIPETCEFWCNNDCAATCINA